MPARRRIAALLTVLAVAIAPAAAFAQSGGAGDDQYVDPIGGGNQQSQPSKGSTGGSGGSGGSGSASAPSLSTAPALSAAQPAQAPRATAGPVLPRTGLDAGAVAALGLALLFAGLGLRVRLGDAGH